MAQQTWWCVISIGIKAQGSAVVLTLSSDCLSQELLHGWKDHVILASGRYFMIILNFIFVWHFEGRYEVCITRNESAKRSGGGGGRLLSPLRVNFLTFQFFLLPVSFQFFVFSVHNVFFIEVKEGKGFVSRTVNQSLWLFWKRIQEINSNLAKLGKVRQFLGKVKEFCELHFVPLQPVPFKIAYTTFKFLYP